MGSAFKDLPEVSKPLLRGVWRDCIVEAVAARDLALHAGLNCVPEAFLCGLFDGTGKLLAALTHPDRYGELLAVTQWPNADDERACLGSTRTARYGGEEFVIIAHHVASVEELQTIVERIRSQIENTEINMGDSVESVTISVGAAMTSAILGPSDGSRLIDAADQLLYQAKNNGRNRCHTKHI